PPDVLPGDMLFAVTTTQGASVDPPPGWTTADVEGASVVSYRAVPADPSTVDLDALGQDVVVTVVRNVDPSDPVAGHTTGAARDGVSSFTLPWEGSPVLDWQWETPQVAVTGGQGLLGWETVENDFDALVHLPCGTGIAPCPDPQWGYTANLLVGGLLDSP